VDAHKGKVEIISEGRDKGSTVKVTFSKKDTCVA
jgi:hypothetical protein